MDLGGEIEIRIRRRLADAVLDARAACARRADHAQERAAVLLAPDQSIRRERVGAIALVAVDGRRAEGACRARMGEKAARYCLPTSERSSRSDAKALRPPLASDW